MYDAKAAKAALEENGQSIYVAPRNKWMVVGGSAPYS